MKVSEIILTIQDLLLIPKEKQFPKMGPLTNARLNRLSILDKDAEFSPDEVKDVSWSRDINEAGLELVKHFEGLYLKAYPDGGGVWTIGYGHTGLQHMDGTVFPGRIITEAKAEELLRYDMNQFEARVSSIITAPLTDDQFSALVSFDFNTGGLTDSKGMPTTITRKLNAKDYEGAALEFPKWNHDNGKVVAGLTRRRASEQRLFRSQHPAIIPA